MESVDVTCALQEDRHAVMEYIIKLYVKLEQKGKRHRSVLGRNRDDINQIENAIPIPVDGLSIKYKSGSGTKIKNEMIGLLVKAMSCM